MSNRERIVEFINRFPGRDDDEISVALKIEPRQTVNQVCRALTKAGILERRQNATGKLGNYYVADHDVHSETQSRAVDVSEIKSIVDATKDWFWEGNVTDAVATYLIMQGWKILSQADTRTKQRGLDIHAIRDNREIVIEVKGYPSKSYRDLSKSDQRKPTSPTSQAQHWYSHATLKVMRLQTAYPSAIVAMAFPDFPRYRQLFKETAPAFERLGIAILFISEAGAIEAVGF